MSGKIHLKTRRQKSLDGMPESSHGVVTLVIRRRDHAEAETFCVSVAQELMRRRNERMGAELDADEHERLSFQNEGPASLP